jgi:hypothetical protein
MADQLLRARMLKRDKASEMTLRTENDEKIKNAGRERLRLRNRLQDPYRGQSEEAIDRGDDPTAPHCAHPGLPVILDRGL